MKHVSLQLFQSIILEHLPSTYADAESVARFNTFLHGLAGATGELLDVIHFKLFTSPEHVYDARELETILQPLGRAFAYYVLLAKMMECKLEELVQIPDAHARRVNTFDMASQLAITAMHLNDTWCKGLEAGVSEVDMRQTLADFAVRFVWFTQAIEVTPAIVMAAHLRHRGISWNN